MINFELLGPEVEPGETRLRPIQRHFHNLIKARTHQLSPRGTASLPSLDDIRQSSSAEGWLPVPGLFGGFMYRLDRHVSAPRLLVETRAGIRLELGPRYVITEAGVSAIEDVASLV
jgi:hypothetical protein